MVRGISPWRPSLGFTAVELLVAVAVIGIIAAIAYSSYTDFVLRSRRSEATEALQNLATLQEQFYSNNKEYSDDLGELGMPATTANDYYQLSIAVAGTVSGTNQDYTLSASPLGVQAADTECPTIQLDWNGTKTPTACW